MHAQMLNQIPEPPLINPAILFFFKYLYEVVIFKAYEPEAFSKNQILFFTL